MPQLSLYLDDASMKSLRKAAAKKGTTMSKYVCGVLDENADKNNFWPQNFFDLYGACKDKTFVEPEDSPFDHETIEALDIT